MSEEGHIDQTERPVLSDPKGPTSFPLKPITWNDSFVFAMGNQTPSESYHQDVMTLKSFFIPIAMFRMILEFLTY